MNNFFYFDICALIVFLIIFGTSYYKKMIKGKTNVLFFTEIGLCSFTCVTKLISSFFFGYVKYNSFTYVLANIFEYLYLLLNSMIIPLAILYILSSVGILKLFETKSVYIIIFIVLVLTPVLLVFDNLFSHKLFTISKTLRLYYGNHYIFLEITSIIYILLCVILVLIYKNFLPQGKFIIGLVMCPILVVFIGIEYYFPNLSFLLFTYAIISYLLNSTSQRPELLINPTVGVWSDFTFFNECKKGYLLNRPATIILIKVLNYKSLILYFGLNNYNSFIRLISSNISSLLRNCKLEEDLFYLDNFTFAVYQENSYEELISLFVGELNYELTKEIVFGDYKILLNPCICVTKFPGDLMNYESLRYFAKAFHHILPQKKGLIWLSEVVHSNEFRIKNEIGSILNRAVKENRFEVFYQPIYSLKENKFVFAEALIRLNDPDFGYVAPSIFLPPAEANGMIFQIGDYVLDNVCKFIASKEFSELGLKYIQMNLSLTQCEDAILVEKIQKCLNRYSLDPSKIRFEITEVSVSVNPTIVKQNIEKLTNKGIYFALDNYGIGYSNIRTVTQLPFSMVKIDKSFVQNLNDEKMLVVLQDVIQMIKVLKKEVVVEGIENEKGVQIFSELNCDFIQGCEYVQGYYYSKPLPKNEFIEFLKNRK